LGTRLPFSEWLAKLVALRNSEMVPVRSPAAAGTIATFR
jgi:hypothetical protein